MFWILICLTGLSLIIFLIGVTWILVIRGRTYRRSGQEVGKEIMTDIMTDDDDGTVLYSTFKGKGISVKREASIGLDDIKSAIKAKDWGTILAILLLISGFFGLCLCGGLSIMLVI